MLLKIILALDDEIFPPFHEYVNNTIPIHILGLCLRVTSAANYCLGQGCTKKHMAHKNYNSQILGME